MPFQPRVASGFDLAFNHKNCLQIKLENPSETGTLDSPNWIQLQILSTKHEESRPVWPSGLDTVGRSVVSPSETTDPALLAVGALNFPQYLLNEAAVPAGTNPAEPLMHYSSYGPVMVAGVTNTTLLEPDSRRKPDVVAASGVITHNGRFGGTSAATGHAGGLVALAVDQFKEMYGENYSNDAVASYIRSNTVTPGDDELDSKGHGRILLPCPAPKLELPDDEHRQVTVPYILDRVGCESADRKNAWARYFTVKLDSESKLLIDMKSAGLTESSAVDPYLYILRGLGPDGVILHQDNDSGNLDDGNSDDKDARILTGALSPGVYTIQATTSGADDIGHFRLSVGVTDSPAKVANVQASARGSSVTVTWDSAENANTYRIQWKAPGQEFSSDRETTFTSDATVKSKTIQLALGVRYGIRVRGENPLLNGEWSDTIYQSTDEPTHSPPAKVSGVALSATTNTISVSWARAARAAWYQVQWRAAGQSYGSSRLAFIDNATTTAYGITDLAPSTQFFVQVAAGSPRGWGDWSDEVSVSTDASVGPPPGAVSGVSLSPGSRSFTASWRPLSSATSYTVQWRRHSEGYSTWNTWSGSGTSHAVTDLEAKTLYYAQVRANNAGGSGPWSSELSVRTFGNPPGQVSGVTLRPGRTDIRVSWRSQSGATGYAIRWRSGSSYESGNQGTSAGTSYRITGLSPDTTYYVQVQATNQGGGGVWSTETSTTTLRPPPVSVGRISRLTLTATANSVTATWSIASNATGYNVQWRESGESFTTNRQATTSSTSHTISQLEADTTYYVRVRGTRGATSGSWSGIRSVRTSEPVPTQVTGVSLTPTAESVAVSWNTERNAATYQVQWSTTSTGFGSHNQGTTTPPTTRYTIRSLSAETTHYIRVRAVNSAGNGPWSITVSARTLPVPAQLPTKVTGLALTSGQTTVTASWSVAARATSYVVQWRSSSQSFGTTRQATVTGTSRSITGLSPATLYYVRVAASNSAGTGPFSDVRSVRTQSRPDPIPGKVTGVSLTAGSATSIGASWNSRLYATSYVVQWRSSSQSFGTTRQATVTGTSRSITGLSPATLYYVRVAASNSAGTGPFSDVRSVRTQSRPDPVPGKVTGVSLTAGQTSVEVSWNSRACADSYVVQWRQRSQSFNTTSRQVTTTNTSRIVAGLNRSTRYYFQVSARNESGKGPASDEVSVVTQSRPVVPPGHVQNIELTPGTTTIAVRYSRNSSATSYRVQWRSSSQLFSSSRQRTTVNTAITLAGLEGATTYYIRVMGVNSGGNGPWSPSTSGVSTTTSNPVPGAPRNVSRTVTSHTLSASWTAGSHADEYDVQWRKQGQQFSSSRSVTTSRTSYKISGLDANTYYFVRVRSSNTGGNGQTQYSSYAFGSRIRTWLDCFAPTDFETDRQAADRVHIEWENPSGGLTRTRLRINIQKFVPAFNTWVAEREITEPANSEEAWHLGMDNSTFRYKIRSECIRGENSEYTSSQLEGPYRSSGARDESTDTPTETPTEVPPSPTATPVGYNREGVTP